MASAPFYQATKDRWIVKDLFPKGITSAVSDLFSRIETSANGRDGLFNSKSEALKAIKERKLETGRGLTDAELTKKFKKQLEARGYKTWGETPLDVRRSISTSITPSAIAKKEELPRFKKEGLSKRLNEKTRKLLKTKKPINPLTGLPYTLKEYTELTPGKKQRVNMRMQGKRRTDVRYKPRQGYYPEKDANRLINYMKIAAEQQEKAGIPAAERTYTTVFDKNNKFIGVNDVRRNQVFTHVDYDLAREGAIAGKVITQHPNYENMQEFFKAAKKFKYESPDKLLGSYFAKYERVPTYNEIFTFFTTDRNAPLKTFKNNSLTLQHQQLMIKEPTGPFQLLTQIKNTEAATIMGRFNKGQISAEKADYLLKKIGAAQEGLGVAAETITPGKGLGVAKRETVKLFKDAVKVNPNIPQDMAAKLMINEISKLKPGSKAYKTICTIGKFEGGAVQDCVNRVAQEPGKFAEKFKNITAESGPLAKIKNAALGFLKSPGVKRFTLAGAAGAVGAALVKEFRNDDPTTYLSNEDQQKSMLVEMAMDPIAPGFSRPDILDYQLPAAGALVAGSTVAAAPSTIKASKSRALGVEKKRPGIVKTGFRTLGRGLGVAASPGLLAPLAAMDLTRQVSEGDSALEIATNPMNYLYPAFSGQTDKLTRGINPTLRKIGSLGLGKVGLKALSRAGIVGLAASLGIQGYNLLDD